MKIGQLVMLVKRNLSEYGPTLMVQLEIGGFPPIGACGEVIRACTGSPIPATHVNFPNYPDKSFSEQETWWCIKTSWLMPINDPDAVKASDDQLELNLSDRIRERIKALTSEHDRLKIGRELLEETEE